MKAILLKTKAASFPPPQPNWFIVSKCLLVLRKHAIKQEIKNIHFFQKEGGGITSLQRQEISWPGSQPCRGSDCSLLNAGGCESQVPPRVQSLPRKGLPSLGCFVTATYWFRHLLVKREKWRPLMPWCQPKAQLHKLPTFSWWTEGKEPKSNVCTILRETTRDISQQVQVTSILKVCIHPIWGCGWHGIQIREEAETFCLPAATIITTTLYFYSAWLAGPQCFLSHHSLIQIPSLCWIPPLERDRRVSLVPATKEVSD